MHALLQAKALIKYTISYNLQSKIYKTELKIPSLFNYTV